MKHQLKIVEYENFVHKQIQEDHRIGEEIFLMDEYQLSPVRDYEFIAPDNIFIEVLSGKGYITVNGVRHDVAGHSLIVYLKGQHIKVRVLKKKTVQRGAAFTDAFMEDMYQASLRFNDIKSSLLTNPVVSLNAEQSYGLNTYINVLKHIAAQKDNPNNLICAKHITIALFYGPMHGVFKKKQEDEYSRIPLISSGFFSLVEEHFMEMKSLDYYAERLNISKPHLHNCIKETSGNSPGYWIDYYRLNYAKKQLSNRAMSVLEIALKLNFAGLPQFCKFFKKKTGLTPNEFRKSLL